MNKRSPQLGEPDSRTAAASALLQHPQGGVDHPRHPQGCPAKEQHHPHGRVSGTVNQATAADSRRIARAELPGGGARSATEAVPPAGALRPLARAVLSVAAEIHAARHDPLHAGCHRVADGLRMAEHGVRDPVRRPVRSRGRLGATPERTGSGLANVHVNATPPPPLDNPDCMGSSS